MDNRFSPAPASQEDDDNQYSEHTGHLFCPDPLCPCKESQTLIGELAGYVDQGLASVDDANRIYRGKTV